ncbi:hypothetical protein [Prevotella falsenii]|uniref:hypothetical protein n=1 Tax=Prevotella falsenii TaxID=515414 RepID=UPI0018DDE0A7|nr:hypothetical protein [Prevotella falsenii]
MFQRMIYRASNIKTSAFMASENSHEYRYSATTFVVTPLLRLSQLRYDNCRNSVAMIAVTPLRL